MVATTSRARSSSNAKDAADQPPAMPWPVSGSAERRVVARVRDGQPGRDDAAEQAGDLGELVVSVASADLRRQGCLVGGTEPGKQGDVRTLVSVTAR
jgi:hypothetical protein